MRAVVVHINDDSVSRHAVQLAGALARRWGAEVKGVAVMEPMLGGVGWSADTAALVQDVTLAQRNALHALGERLIDEARRRHPVSFDFRLMDGDPIVSLLGHARAADLLIVSQRASPDTGGLPHGQIGRLLVGSSGPVLVVPNTGYVAQSAPAEAEGGAVFPRVLVAWSDTREGARAVRDALPLLREAHDVEIVSFVSSERDDLKIRERSLVAVESHLRRHGVRVSARLVPLRSASASDRLGDGWIPDVSVTEALQSRAADIDANLVVMGAYGHSRLWELMLGGVTKSMLMSMSVPVLMSN